MKPERGRGGMEREEEGGKERERERERERVIVNSSILHLLSTSP